MNKEIYKFNQIRLKAYQKLSLKQPLTNEQFKEYKSLAKELYGIDVK